MKQPTPTSPAARAAIRRTFRIPPLLRFAWTLFLVLPAAAADFDPTEDRHLYFDFNQELTSRFPVPAGGNPAEPFAEFSYVKGDTERDARFEEGRFDLGIFLEGGAELAAPAKAEFFPAPWFRENPVDREFTLALWVLDANDDPGSGATYFGVTPNIHAKAALGISRQPLGDGTTEIRFATAFSPDADDGPSGYIRAPFRREDIGKWTHYALTAKHRAGKGNRFEVNAYRNGVRLNDDGPLLSRIPDSWGFGILIGGEGPSLPFEQLPKILRFRGGIDELRIYDRALSDEEVAELADYELGSISAAQIGGTKKVRIRLRLPKSYPQQEVFVAGRAGKRPLSIDSRFVEPALFGDGAIPAISPGTYEVVWNAGEQYEDNPIDTEDFTVSADNMDPEGFRSGFPVNLLTTDDAIFGAVSGRLASPTGVPLRNVKVSLLDPENPDAGSAYATRSQDDGEYSLARIDPGDYLLRVEGAPYFRSAHRTIGVRFNHRTVEDFVLQPVLGGEASDPKVGSLGAALFYPVLIGDKFDVQTPVDLDVSVDWNGAPGTATLKGQEADFRTEKDGSFRFPDAESAFDLSPGLAVRSVSAEAQNLEGKTGRSPEKRLYFIDIPDWITDVPGFDAGWVDEDSLGGGPLAGDSIASELLAGTGIQFSAFLPPFATKFGVPIPPQVPFFSGKVELKKPQVKFAGKYSLDKSVLALSGGARVDFKLSDEASIRPEISGGLLGHASHILEPDKQEWTVTDAQIRLKARLKIEIPFQFLELLGAYPAFEAFLRSGIGAEISKATYLYVAWIPDVLANLRLKLQDDSGDWDLGVKSFDGGGGVALEGGVNVGLDNVVDGRVGAGGRVGFAFAPNFSPVGINVESVTLTPYLTARIRTYGANLFSGKISKKITLYEDEETALRDQGLFGVEPIPLESDGAVDGYAVVLGELSTQEIGGEPELPLPDRAANVLAPNLLAAPEGGRPPGVLAETILVENVSPTALPAVGGTTGGPTVLFPVDDSAKAPAEGREIRALRRNGAGWSDAGAGTDDFDWDTHPEVQPDADGDLVAVWQKLEGPVPESGDPADFPPARIAYARLVDGAWTETRLLPPEATYNGNLFLARDPDGDPAWDRDGDLAVFWTASEEPLPGRDSNVSLHRADWDPDTNRFGEAREILAPADLAGFASYKADIRGDRTAVVFGRDVATGDDPADQQVFLARWDGGDGPSIEPVSDPATHGNANGPAWVSLDDQGDADVLWVSGQKLFFRPGGGDSREVALPLERTGGIASAILVRNPANDNLKLLWAELGEPADVYLLPYDAAGDRWGLPASITRDDSWEGGLDGWFDADGILHAVYLKTEVERSSQVLVGNDGRPFLVENVPEEGRVDLVHLEYEPFAAYEASGIRVVSRDDPETPVNPDPGDQATIAVDVKALGDFLRSGDDAPVEVYAGSVAEGNRIGTARPDDSAIPPNATATAFLDWTVPGTTDRPVELIARAADPGSDPPKEARVRSVLPQLRLESPRVQWRGADRYAVTVRVANEGGIPSRPFSLALSLLPTDGSSAEPEPLARKTIESGRAGWSEDYVFEVDASRFGLPQTLLARIETEFPEELSPGQDTELPVRVQNNNPARYVEAPGRITLRREDGAVKVSWEASSGQARAHLLERRTDGGEFRPLARVEPGRGSYRDETAEPGGRYDYRLRALGSHDASPLTAPVGANVTVDEELETVIPARWTERHGLAGPLDRETDHDGDGLNLLAEYALGTDPLRSDAAEAFRVETVAGDGGTYPVFSYGRLRSPGALRYVVEVSTDLRDWFEAETVGFAVTTEEADEGMAAEYENAVSTSPEPIESIGPVFFRIRLTE